MQVIGICRFSYVGTGGFQVEHDTPEERAAYLFDADRLEERFRTFESFTLPSIKAQTDPDFTFLIVISTLMPDVARRRLMDLVSGVPQILVEAWEPRRHRAVMRDAINGVRLDNGEFCLQFRLDDDDAVAVDFVEKLRRDGEKLVPFLQGRRHVALDFRKGYVVSPDEKGMMFGEIDEPCWTPALAIAFAPDVDLTVMNFSHNKLPRAMAVVSFADDAMFIRGINNFNDSRQKDGTKPYDMKRMDAETKRAFRQRFGIEPAKIKTLYGG
ncbi:MAG: glycosyltransferase [Paracoccaceae bacterium]